jgi:23S rRNA (guanosine2251-2'-O)-methyltransferase
MQHQGIIAFKSAIRYQNLQQVIDFVLAKGDTPLFYYFRWYYRC